SLAIIEYLNEIVPEPPLLPADAYGRARCREIAYVVACDIHPVNNLRVGRYMKKLYDTSDDDTARWHRHWIKIGFDAIEAVLASGGHTGKFCEGDTPTLADCCLIPQVYNARRFEVSLSPYPTIAAIDAACAKLDAFRRAAPEAQADAPAMDQQ
ncbi:MAG TPA: maleylacetoacetate isomerase, partial [Rhodanobacteraceae bacterium]|nr:maleylacetoacetate isomerase [Rhodanobacteraceae bacterium]